MTFSQMEQHIFHTMGEIKPEINLEPEPDLYYRPRSQTFESIDALCVRQGDYDELFQMTVAKTHGIKVRGLQEVLRYLTKKKVRIYFVVPANIYPEFETQNYLTLQGKKYTQSLPWITDKVEVEQWVLKLNYFSF